MAVNINKQQPQWLTCYSRTFQMGITHISLCGNITSVHEEKQHFDLIISASWRRHLQKDKETRLRMVSRSKAVFQIQNIRLRLLRRLSIYQQQELSCFSWLHKTAPAPPGGTGADHQRFSATMLSQNSKTKAQSCSGDALWLRFNVAAGRLPRWRAALSSQSNTDTEDLRPARNVQVYILTGTRVQRHFLLFISMNNKSHVFSNILQTVL